MPGYFLLVVHGSTSVDLMRNGLCIVGVTHSIKFGVVFWFRQGYEHLQIARGQPT